MAGYTAVKVAGFADDIVSISEEFAGSAGVWFGGVFIGEVYVVGADGEWCARLDGERTFRAYYPDRDTAVSVLVKVYAIIHQEEANL